MTPTVDHVLLNIALNLSSNRSHEQQYQNLIDGVAQVFPCDASCLFIFDEDGFLTPVAVKGLSSSVLGRRYFPKAHPRLDAIIHSREPVRFDADCSLPDPFDGTLLTEDQCIDVHDCMGFSLYVEGQLVGALTMDALTIGAFDDIDPVAIETFAALTAATLRNIAQLKALKAQNQKQKSVTQTLIQQARSQHGEMVGLSPQINQLRNNIATVAQSDYAVLITGETGTGKELVAHSVHAQSHRSDKPMIYVNCAALPESLAESELFGHVKGAFTGANSHRAGKFELADGGTIFLDEVGAGTFRADLFHRLNVFPIQVPPLRARDGDIPVLAGYLLEKVRQQFNAPNLHVHPKVLTQLESLPWYGNVRELEHTLTRAALHAIQQGASTIMLNHFDTSLALDDVKNTSHYLPKESQPMRELIESFQRDLIEHALSQTGGVWAKAAEFLQMDRGNLYRMGKKLGINK